MMDAVSRTDPPGRASLVTALLVAVALAGCVGTLPAPAGSGAADGPAESGDGVRQGEAADPPLTASVRVTGPTGVNVSIDVSAPTPNATVVIRYGASVAVEPRTLQTAPVGGTVALSDLASNQTHRIRVELVGPRGDRLDGETFLVRTPNRAWANGESVLVQPGAYIDVGPKGCTLGFILTSAVNASAYGLTAGHCLDGERGTQVRVGGAGGPVIGTVAVYELDEYFVDWGLIRLDADILDQTSPAVRGIGGPTGVADVAEYDRDQALCTRGHSALSLPRTWVDSYDRRCGVFADHIPSNGSWNPCDPADRDCGGSGMPEGLAWYTWYGPIAWGDSGSPVIDAGSGEAVGIGTRFNDAILRGGSDGTALGPTLASILDRAETFGYHLRLATAPYDPPDRSTP